MKFTTRISIILYHTDIEPLEISNAVVLLLWGLWVGSPFWNTFLAARSYELLAQITPDLKRSEMVWAALAITAGGLSLVSILFYLRRLRFLAISLSAFIWLFVGVAFFISNPTTTGAPIFSFFALSNLFILVSRSLR